MKAGTYIISATVYRFAWLPPSNILSDPPEDGRVDRNILEYNFSVLSGLYCYMFSFYV